MSTETHLTPDAQQTEAPACNAIDRILHSRSKDLGGFSVRRLLPDSKQRKVGPWVFFDHMGPAEFAPGPGINVRPHPHVNLATVTYLFEGEILHRDSLGSLQTIRPGDINLMVAGRGIVHSERETPAAQQTTRRLHGLQLWLALPDADEETDPAFLHYPSADIPTVMVGDVPVRVMVGSAYGVASPVKTFAQTLYLEADLKTGQPLTLPDTVAERALYIASGGLQADGENLPEYSMAILKTGAEATVTATQDSRIALIGGEAMPERYVWWNFVSSRKERIGQAAQAWKDGLFPLPPGDEEEFIPLPE
ncbi:pirin family protein [Candidatus Thiothrix sp. Deng01]|uniref:Pirin family protein n=1 Tax=Candidatus Thiothrix phosphatis TaxID=3112415 RepID=A0ABU6D0X8_9GAMM|nr:pirin family protein [Candidatus Thiothrix sp. Deng01]MEB4592694.1 pirin family protein [Candidatus Thiothrix sp. Deng01]